MTSSNIKRFSKYSHWQWRFQPTTF